MGTAFAGIVYPDVLQISDLIDGMLSPMLHRGSKKKNTFTFKNIQLGCLGPNFTSNEKATVYLCLDGWIENGSEIRQTLASDGVEVPSNNDLQTIIAAYEHWGELFLNRLNGDFALAILDTKNGSILLAKDYIGKRPLYWFHDRHYFIFASELKSLLTTGIVPQAIASDSIASYLYFGFIPQDMTAVEKVNKLLPAHYLHFSLQTGMKIQPYWSYSSCFLKRAHMHKSQIIVHLNDLLSESVRRRIPPAGPLACTVSGGLGSATIAYYVKKFGENHTVEAFTTAFRGESDEDLLAAKTACESLKMPQIIGEMTPRSFLEDFPKIAWILDEPLSDPNILSTWKFIQKASTFSNTIYSGMGSDELLAGHSRYSLAERNLNTLNRLMLLPRPLLRNVLIPIFKMIYPPSAYNMLRILRTNPSQFEYLGSQAIFNEAELESASPKLANYFHPETFLHKFYNLPNLPSNVSALQYFDVKTRLPDLYIFQFERLTRAAGINWQTPFLDKRIVEFAASLPEPEALLEKETGSYLKPLVAGVFPDNFLNRPKKTRKYFLANWVDNPEIAEVFRMLSHGLLVDIGLISPAWIEAQLQDQLTMRLAFPQLYAVLSLEVWFRLFINRSITTTPPSMSLQELLRE